jgi:predicted O-linked N-acetylglucosamine transferase (SPINDLY family)
LVTRSLDEYEALALRLARDSEVLAAFKGKLIENRLSCPLFNTGTYTHHIESAYRTMWEIWQRGEPPRGFRVDPA